MGGREGAGGPYRKNAEGRGTVFGSGVVADVAGVIGYIAQISMPDASTPSASSVRHTATSSRRSCWPPSVKAKPFTVPVEVTLSDRLPTLLPQMIPA